MAAHRRAFGVRPVLRWAVRYANNFFIFLEGLGNFPTSKIPVRRVSGRTGIYGSGYPLPMLAMNIFIPYALMPYYGAMPGFAKLPQKKNAAILKKRLQRSLNLIQF